MSFTDNFYKNIIKTDIPLRELLKTESLFKNIPKDWYVLVTDVVGSSKAVANGKHGDINLTATGSVISVLNTIKKNYPDLRVPYFFGGDGATFIIPQFIIQKIESVLLNYSLHIKKTLNLDLRVGKVIVKKVYDNNYNLKIAKLKHNKYLTTPIILGNGLKFAEAKIKSEYNANSSIQYNASNIDLEGMECRWDEIMPPSKDKKVVCLLINATDEKKQPEIFAEVVAKIDSIFGTLKERTPITRVKLKLKPTIEKIRNEMYTKLGYYNSIYLLTNWLVTNIGVLYFKYFSKGKNYLDQIVQLSDTIMLDGTINTVLSGSKNQIEELKIFLDDLENQNKIIFGMHNTYASIMSCYVQNREDKHIHFIDGTEGGYTSASVDYKRKHGNV